MWFNSVALWAGASIGGAVVASYVWSGISFLTFHFLPFGNSLKRWQRQPQAWAVVTGASAGMGLGYAQELALRGFGVILLGHKTDELDEAIASIKAEVKSAHVEKIVMDATRAGYSDIEWALAPFVHLPITILINNLSVVTSKPLFKTFSSLAPDEIDGGIIVNNIFLCNITRILYPILKRHGPSLVLNISSMGHLVGLPWLAIYCGTKAFTESFSVSLARELHQEGDSIDSICIVPGDVRTQGNRYGFHANSPDGRQYARMVLDRVGRAASRGILIYSPYWQHALTMALVKILPEAIVVSGSIADMAQRVEAESKAK